MRYALLLSVLCVSPSAAQEDVLDKRITVDFKNTRIADVIAYLRDVTGLNMVVDRRAAERLDAVTLKLTDVPVRSALRWIATLSKVDFTLSNGVVVFVVPEQPGTTLETRLFEIGGLTSRPADFPAPSPAVEPLKQPVVVLEGNDVRGTPEDSTVDLIKQVIAPSSWDADDISMQTVQPGRISVRHFPAILDQIEKFLAALRKMAPAMVTVDAELFEIDADAAGRLDRLFGTAVDAAAAKTLLEALQPLRRARNAETLRLTCSEGQRTHVLVGSQRAINVFTGNRAEPSTFASSTTLEVRPALTGRAVKLDVAVRSTRLAEPLATAKIGGWDVDLPESLHSSLRTTLVIPENGLAVLLLPRAARDARLPRVMLLRASATADAPAGLDFGGAQAADPLEAKGTIDCKFDGAPVADVVDYLRATLGMNIVLHADLSGSTVTLALKGVKAKAAIDLLSGTMGWQTSFLHDALYIAPPSAITRNSASVWIANVRDLSLGAREPGGEETWESASSFDPHEVCDRLRASVQPRSWGDDGTICEATTGGLLVVRHSPQALRDVKAFLEGLRQKSAGVARLRAEVVTVKSEAMDAADAGGYLVDAAAASKLVAGATIPPERLQIESVLGRRAGLSWTRRRAVVSEGEQGTVEGRNLIDLLPTDGRVTLGVETQDVGETAPSARAALRTSIAIPAGKAAVFKLGSGEGVTRLLIVRMETK